MLLLDAAEPHGAFESLQIFFKIEQIFSNKNVGLIQRLIFY